MGEIKRGIGSVKTQEGRQPDGILYDQTKAAQSSSIGVKLEVKVEVPPPRLSYTGGNGGIFGQIPSNIPTQTKRPKDDTDSIMTDKHTTLGRKHGDQQAQFAKDERGGRGKRNAATSEH